jgi:acyl carrier protein
MTASVADQVRALIIEVLPPSASSEDVTDEAELGESGLGLDSVALVDLLCACEDHFGISLPAEVLLDGEAGLSVADLIRHVSRRLADTPS